MARDITDRKQAEQALQQERDFTAAILNTVGALVVVLDRQGQIVRFNRTCEVVTGYSCREVQGTEIWNFLLPEEKQTVQSVFTRLLAGQLQNQYENIWVSKTGEQRLISWSNTALTDEQGAVDYIIATGIDVTERRQAQEQLERSYRQAQLLAEITRKIRQSLELEEILQTTVSEVQNLLACDRVLIYQVFPDGTSKTISEVVLPEYPAILGMSFPEEVFPKSSQKQYRQGRVRVLADVHAPEADIPNCLKEFFDQLAVKAGLVVPILQNLSASKPNSSAVKDRHPTASESRLWGLLIAHQCSHPRQWETLEIDLLQQLGDQIGVALSQAQILDHLEERVAERTIDITNINRQLQQEIKERQVAQAVSQENQQKLAGILETADEAIISIDQEQRIQLFNQGAEKIFGYAPSEVLGEPLNILLPEAFRSIHQQHFRRFSSSGSTSRQMAERSANVFGRRKNGEEFPAEASISKLGLKAGRIFTVILKDVTERQRSEAALRRSEAQLRLITDALPVLISYIDTQQRYRFNNQTYEEWFGLSRFQIKGRQVCEVLGEEAYQQIQIHINTALSGQPVIFESEVPFKIGTRWISGTYVPDFGEHGEVKGFFALINDISNLKAVQQMKSEFISVVSHELRTPLTSIHGSLKLLSTGRLGNLTQSGQEMLNIALKNTDRLTRLVSDILDLERIESGKVSISPQTCTAANLLRQAVEVMASMARAEDITLATAPVTAQVWADPDGVVQVLTNLISNAIKFSPPGSTISLAAANQGQDILFQVKDQGRGIPVDKLESIFERFQQVDASDSRSKGGTGLGLAICQEIVRRHGGRIWTESTLGKGSTFCFTLPTSKQEKGKV